MAQKPGASGNRMLLMGAAGALLLAAGLGGGGWWAWKAFSARNAAPAPAPPATPNPDAARTKPQTQGWAAASYCPERTLAFLGIRNLPDMGRRFQETDLFQAFSGSLAGLDPGRLPPKAGVDWKDLMASLSLLTKALKATDGETVLAVTELEHIPHYRPLPHALLLLRPASGTDLEALGAEAFSALAAEAPDLKRGEHRHRGVLVRTLGDGDVTFAQAVHEGTLLIASHEATLHESLDRAAGKGSALAGHGAFKELSEALASKDLFGFFNPASLWDALPEQDHKTAKALGLTEIDGVGMSLEIAPPLFVERLALHTDKPRAGLLVLLDNPPLEDPASARVPARTLAFARARMAPPGEAFDKLLAALKAALAPADMSVIQGTLQEVKRGCGFDVRTELLQSLGGTLSSTLSIGPDPAHPDLAYGWALSDRALCANCIEKTLSTTARTGGRPFSRQWLEGAEIFLLDLEGWNRCMPAPLPPTLPPLAFGFLGGELVLANHPEVVAGLRPADQPLPEDVRTLLGSLPKDCWAVSCTDLGGLLGLALESMPQGQEAANQAPPFLQAVLKGEKKLPPMVSWASSTPRTVLIESRGPLPLLTAAFAGAAALPVLLQRQPGVGGDTGP